MIKDTSEQPDKEIQRTRSAMALRAEASLPTEAGCAALQHVGVPTQRLSLLGGFLWGFYGGFIM